MLDNVRIAFPYFHKDNTDDIYYTIITYGTEVLFATVVWGEHNTPFLKGGKGGTVLEAIESLHRASAEVVWHLLWKEKLQPIEQLEGEGLGMLVEGCFVREPREGVVVRKKGKGKGKGK